MTTTFLNLTFFYFDGVSLIFNIIMMERLIAFIFYSFSLYGYSFRMIITIP